MADGMAIAEFLEKKGYKIKTKTRTSLVVLVEGNRLQKMLDLAELLSNLGAKIDKNLKGSSIGGIVIDNVKILVKGDGKTGGLDVEAQAINDLTDAVMTAIILTGGPISIRMKNKTVKGVAGVNKTAGTPKSDFHLHDENDKPLIHISHKKGSTPRDFQQWGGLTEKRIAEHKEVVQFGIACRALYGSQIPNGQSCYTTIKDKGLKMMAVFGVNYDKGGIDENRVDVLLQGDPGLEYISDGLFELTATGHVHYHGDVPDGGFDPVLAMIYKGDRDQLGIKGARASIYPTGGRTFKTKL
jgi:hypothetical protein